MDATAFLMNCYGIPQSDRGDVEKTFKTTSPEHLDLALRMMGQHPDDEDFDVELGNWPLSIESHQAQA